MRALWLGNDLYTSALCSARKYSSTLMNVRVVQLIKKKKMIRIVRGMYD